AAFMAALLTADSSNEDRVALQVDECESMGISVLPPSVNESLANFTLIADNTIRFGLKAIKGIGDQPIASIVEAREKKGKFAHLEDFFRRVPAAILNKKLIEALAYSGAMDNLGERKAIAASVDEVVRFAKSIQRTSADHQTDIFGMLSPEEHGGLADFQLKKILPATRLEKLQWEKEFLGLFVSGHPLQGLRKYLMKKAHPIFKIDETMKGKTVKICGLCSRMKRLTTKTGAYMASLILEDLTGRMDIVVFPKVYEKYGACIGEGRVIMVEGRVDLRGDRLQCMAMTLRDVSLDSMLANARSEGLFDEHEKYTRTLSQTIYKEEDDPLAPYVIRLTEKIDEDSLAYLKKLLSANRGDRPVVILMKNGEKEQTLKVPFGVDVTRELKQKIGEIAR
ncbi:hypothetical protein HYV58_00125, partial [Candidatus Peregrinibacteria bacterium]|nr:hypothetical protein [Candidatus Peregrinibacteria bacterium]